MPPLGLPIYGQKSGIDARRWKSLAEHAGTAATEPGEFPEGAAEPPEGFTRRGFLQILGASVAMTTLEACKPPREKLVPFVRPPAGVTPGVPSRFATATSDRGYGFGIVVDSWEGRPTKVEGNRAHPASLGATDPVRQAFILDLYDPRRLKGFTRGPRSLSFASLLNEVSALARAHEADGGARLRFLVDPTSSPTVADLRERILKRFPRARFVAWSPTGAFGAGGGAALAFGRPLETILHVAQADVILALDADFLGREGDHVRQARDFASRREGERMNRLYVAEAPFTITGGMADHRLRMRSAEVLPFARAVAAELAAGHGLGALAPLGAPGPEASRKVVAAVAKDLAGARGKALVIAGERQPSALHALAAAMNEALGAVGQTVSYAPPALLDAADGPFAIGALARELDEGKVEALVVTAWNPLYTAPADLELRRCFAKVKDTLVLALREDETVRAASWRLAASHPLETWGDLRARDGTISLVQPLIAPLFESASEIDLLAAFLDEGDRGSWRIVRDGWRRRTGAGPEPAPTAGSGAAQNPPDSNLRQPQDPFERRWEAWLAAGVVPGTASGPEKVTVNAARVAEALRSAPAPQGGVEVGFVPDYKVRDGRWLENAWLQELPDPITKLTWDNAAWLSPATARRLGVEDGDVLDISRGGRFASAPALIVPGHADESITLALGYGQRGAGPVGKDVGYDAYALRTSDAPWVVGGAEVKKAGRRHVLAVTQGHFSMEGREIALATDVDRLPEEKRRLDDLRGSPPTIQDLPTEYAKADHAWGMSIDLSRCIGCAACTAACQAENNIPVVGKEQVIRNREMHWIRVDRYFEGTPEDPRSVTQPLACQHCERAPCEYVCPVNATVHSDEGLNEMVYNRCVGTRYCSNNCPYKVRRFNFFDYHGDVPPTLQMLMNPDVTVRARGVMEKCTYCVQRIERGRIQARTATPERKDWGNDVTPACAQACPAEAIVFGDLKDPAARVLKKHQDPRRYDLLHELGTLPRTAFLVKLRNPNPELA